MPFICEPIQFQWDKGNQEKNWIRHQTSMDECEEAFYDPKKRLIGETESRGEYRRILIGKTKFGRLLFVVFTIRNDQVRVISAGNANRKERVYYDEET